MYAKNNSVKLFDYKKLQISLHLSSVEVNVRVGRVGLECLVEVLEAEKGVLFGVGALLDEKWSSLDKGVWSVDKKDKMFLLNQEYV